ncbi:hypothetical protein ZWY2020_036744 [Hordeum vulgare]|nr:hypothetical protein ZWY2020_036744 [Hordeum vulgare]
MQAVLVAPGVKDNKVLAFRRDALKEKDAVSALMRTIAAGGVRSAFYVFDLARVVDLYRGWRRALPGVRSCYAVKCNPEPALLGALAALGRASTAPAAGRWRPCSRSACSPAALCTPTRASLRRTSSTPLRWASTSPPTTPRRRWSR